ncbi:hypothetical protein [Flavobacterium flavigenum]|uniref:hypothetical protein n=1 Tax=Flavobacterium flavigenum TaxID=3003258 RepID=UPI00248299CF|nr:hypothetical protein [Flavobacterium flavigenum]
MKKIIFLLCLSFFLSCTNDNNTTDSSNILLKKIVTHNYGTTYETIFTYDGNKLLQQKSNRQKKVFTYQGDNIVKIEWYQNPNSENELLQYVNFEYYPDGTLKRFKKYLDAPVTVDFIYNANGTVEFSYVADYNSYYNYTGRFKIDNQEISQFEFLTGNSPKSSIIFHYDNKNHPLKNVTGYNKLILFGFFYDSMHNSGFSTNSGNMQNQISYSYSSEPNTKYTTNSLEYNSNNFPTSINKDDDYVADYLFY